jgi:hypothetical protein
MRTKVCGAAVVLLAGIAVLEGCNVSQDAGAGPLNLPTPTALRTTTDPGKIAMGVPGQSRYFPSTRQTLSQPFLNSWNLYGGVQIFGFPISGVVKVKDPRTGEQYTAQYFERARFELHASTGKRVILGRLGTLVHPPDPPVKRAKDAFFWKQTGHNVSGAFLKFWKEHGGLEIFGYPISEVLTERSRVDGKLYKVQYFERARFELHPERAGTPDEVQLGRLGAEIYQRR